MKNRCVWTFMLLTLLAGCASSGGRPPAPQPPPPPEIAPLGIVAIDERTGERIVGAQVDVQVTESEDDGRTNEEGYWVQNVPMHREFEVWVSAEGYHVWKFVVPALSGGLHKEALITPLGPAPGGHPSPIIGRLRLEGGCFRDDTGCLNPLYTHAGNLFSLYTRDQHRAREELDAIAAAGYHGFRTWSTLGGHYWRGREVGDYTTPDYLGWVRAFFQEAQGRGLRLVWSQGDIGFMRDRRGTMAAFAQIDNELGGVIDFIDCGNEAWQTGESDAGRLAECVGHYKAAGGRAIASLTDAPIYNHPGRERETFDYYSRPPADVYDIHSYRGGDCEDKSRHAFNYGYELTARLPFGISSEPPGPGDLVSVTSNKHELDDECLGLLATDSLLGRQAFVHFTGEGVIVQRGLASEAGFWSVPKIVAVLPRDLMTYRTITHSGSSKRGIRVLAVPNDDVRIDGRISDGGQFVFTLKASRPGSHRIAVEKSFEGQICHTGTATCDPVSQRAGETFDVSFTRGRILIGRIQ